MILDAFRLADKVAIVTGGGRGIGRAIALAFAEAGADVVVAARRTAVLEEVTAAIRERGRRGLAVTADMRRGEDIDRVLGETLAALGRVDIVVNNAGGHPPRVALAQDDDDFNAAYHFNVTSALHLSRIAAPHLGRARGAIVNISSAMSTVVDSGFVAYGAAKAALNHMTRLLAEEWAPHVRVNALAVGATRTDALEAFAGMPGMLEQMVARHPLGRLGQPEDIAAAALFLASPAAAWITGKVIEIDGGATDSTWPWRIPSGLDEQLG